MIKLEQKYDRQDFIDFLQESFLQDYARDVRPVSTEGLSSIKKASSLGSSKSLDLQIFEFEYTGSANKRVTLTKEAFQIMKQSATFNALAVFYGGEDDWRFSFLTANPERTEKGKTTIAYSNPRRYSFFLGPNAKTNTPTKFLLTQGKIKDFEDLKSRFSIEVVNKEFYKEISKAFTKLVDGQLKLPFVQDKSQTSLEFAVRLIGRVIFCWFLREKKSEAGLALMPKELLSLEATSKYDDYYHAILEPIFFEVLNKPIKTRKDDFAKEPFSVVPYLNGGLFSPQDEDYYKRSNGDLQSQFHNTLVIPDSWFKDFFETLETYNFTIDENTSFDEELSIDPEMLGRIFENLLAEINPETGESARKSTGSYYTPRTIVNYMVDESLLLYLKEQTNVDEKKLRAIISYDLDDDAEYSVKPEEREKIIEALEKIKILDPACGSGAFPIGALQKIVFILQQVDPDGQLWFKKQIENTPPEVRRVIEREFSHKNFDYIRKLGIIRENIYGVDIQPIATEISRLRCFLTLVVDERIQDSTENRGIEPLPNLEFKFVTANSLIGLPTSSSVNQMELFEDDRGIRELKDLRDAFFNATGVEREQLKLQFVQAQNRMFQRMIDEGRKGYADLTTKLSSWDPFTHKASNWFEPEWMFGIKTGFDIVIANPPYVRADNPEFKEQRQTLKDLKQYKTLYEKWDLFIPFIERGLMLLGENGCLTYITSNSLLTSKFAFRLLDLILMDFAIQFMDYFSDDSKVFEAGVVPVVFGISKMQTSAFVKKTTHEGKFENITHLEKIPIMEFKKNGRDSFRQTNEKLSFKIDTTILGDICYISYGLRPNSDERFWKGEFKRKDLVSKTPDKTHSKKYLEGKNLGNYKINELLYLEWNTDRVPKKLVRPTFEELYEAPKLMRGTMVGGTFDDTGIVCNHSIVVFSRFIDLRGVENRSINNSISKFNSKKRFELEEISTNFELKYVLALLNSNLAQKFLNLHRRHRLKNYFYPDDYRNFPVANLSLAEQRQYANIVDKIITLKKSGSDEDAKKAIECEEKIDQMVYELYGLSDEEIKIVEGKE